SLIVHFPIILMVSLLATLVLGAVWCTGAFPSGPYSKKLANGFCIEIDAMPDFTIWDIVRCGPHKAGGANLNVTGNNPYNVAPSSQIHYDRLFKFLIGYCGPALKSKGMHWFIYDKTHDTIMTAFLGIPQILQRGYC
ncbi:hypothetical protein Pmar_PMAR021608, partial [Perkinsus marinus ATCC 50983]